MKKIKALSLAFFGLIGFSSILVFTLSSCSDSTSSASSSNATPVFSVTSNQILLNTADKPGEYYMNKKYGSNSTESTLQFGPYRMYTISIPINWSTVPNGTNYYALKLVDLTSPWVHWMMANIDASTLSGNQLLENYGFNSISQFVANGLVTGQTSWNSPGVAAQQGVVDNSVSPSVYVNFGGFTPPSSDHEYKLTLYALSSKLTINNYFSESDLTSALSNKVLGEASFNFWYRFTGAVYINEYW